LAYKNLTPGKFPKDYILHSKHGESLQTTNLGISKAIFEQVFKSYFFGYFFVLTTKLASISSTIVLPSGCAMFYYMADVQIFFRFGA
jgi:hypothetical protein